MTPSPAILSVDPRQGLPLHASELAVPARSAPALFSVEGVGFRYEQGRPIFDGLSLAVERGEFLALIGPSGCGKTTLLNLLSGFMAPQRGRIELDGRAVRPELPELGYVFQSPNLFSWLTALENVRFGLRMAGAMSIDEQCRRSRAALALVGLEDAARRFPHELSGGMRQRVALARALVLRPRVLLMDEPFAALDAIARRELNEELLRLWRELEQTIIFITHDIDEAIFLADRVVVLGRAPTGIASELAVDLPRPRTQRDTRSDPRFATLGAELMARIERARGISAQESI